MAWWRTPKRWPNTVVGGYNIGDIDGGGFQQSPSVTFGGSPGDPTVHLDLDLRVGEIDVRQR